MGDNEMQNYETTFRTPEKFQVGFILWCWLVLLLVTIIIILILVIIIDFVLPLPLMWIFVFLDCSTHPQIPGRGSE